MHGTSCCVDRVADVKLHALLLEVSDHLMSHFLAQKVYIAPKMALGPIHKANAQGDPSLKTTAFMSCKKLGSVALNRHVWSMQSTGMVEKVQVAAITLHVLKYCILS